MWSTRRNNYFKAVTDVLLLFIICVLIHQRRLLFWRKCALSDKPVLRTLALCCRDAVGSVCELGLIYQMTTNDNVALPEYVVKQIIWYCFRRTVYTRPAFMLCVFGCLSFFLI